jgi:regulatory protein
MARTPRKATPQSLENAALHYLGRFASSAENLRRVLMRRVERSARLHDTDRGEGRAAVDQIVSRFQASGLVDDGVYAGGRATALHRRGVPSRRIRARLAEKGVASDHIDVALAGLAETAENADLVAAINLARRRRLGPFRPSSARADTREKDLAAMARAGFPYDIARRVIEAETVEELEPFA